MDVAVTTTCESDIALSPNLCLVGSKLKVVGYCDPGTQQRRLLGVIVSGPFTLLGLYDPIFA